MKLKLLVFLFLYGIASLSFGQYKQMLHKPYNEKVEDIDQLYENTVNKGREDSLYIQTYTRRIEQWALANDDDELALEAELLRAYVYWFIDGYKDPKLILGLILLAEKGKHQQIPHIEARAAQVVALHYWETKDYEKAFEWLLRLASILDEMQPESFPNMAEHLNFIGRCYYHFEDYKTALTYYEKSSTIKKTAFNAFSVFEAQATLGLCYQKLGQLTLAENYFLAVLNDSSQYAIPVWKNIVSGNLGYNYFLEGRYEKAIPLLEEDIENALLINDYGLAAGASIPLAHIYLKRGKLQESKQKIGESEKYIQQSGQADRLRDLYPIMSKRYAANNEIDSSAAYLDSAIAAIKAYNLKYSSLKLLRANQRVEAKERQLQIEKLQTKSKLSLSQRNWIIVFILVLLVGAMIAFWFRNENQIEKQELNELMHENTKKALFHSKRALENLTKKVREDNNLLDALKKNKAVEVNQNLILSLKSKSILTQEDWVQYQSLFNNVYPNFSPSLIASYPDLSQAEIRCLYLEKIQLSNNEMALVLGVSSNTMRVTKHRIRKKLELESQEAMKALLQKLG
jgi:tetratricopeptide (TPR) repeat protein